MGVHGIPFLHIPSGFSPGRGPIRIPTCEQPLPAQWNDGLIHATWEGSGSEYIIGTNPLQENDSALRLAVGTHLLIVGVNFNEIAAETVTWQFQLGETLLPSNRFFARESFEKARTSQKLRIRSVHVLQIGTIATRYLINGFMVQAISSCGLVVAAKLGRFLDIQNYSCFSILAFVWQSVDSYASPLLRGLLL